MLDMTRATEYIACLKKLLAAGTGDGPYLWITTRKLDAILQETFGEKYGLACNSMMRNGLIDYHCDGDWTIDFTEEELKEWETQIEEEANVPAQPSISEPRP